MSRGPSKRTIIPKGVPFGMVPHAVTEDLEVTNAGFRVYAEMVKLANTESRAWPGHRYLERVLPMSRKTVQNALRNLEDTGWLVVNRTDQRHTYMVVFEQARLDLEWSSFDTGGETTPVQNVPQTGAVLIPEPGQKLPLTKNQTDTQDRNPFSHEAQLARKGNPKPEWDFLILEQGFNMPTITPYQKRRVGKLVTEIKASLDHEQIEGYDDRWRTLHTRAAAWPHHFDGATLTPEAFAKWFTQLGQPVLKRSKGDNTRAATSAAMDALEAGRR